MKLQNTAPSQWIKASKSNTDGSCVEQRRSGGRVEVRDTKAGGRGPTLAMSREGFAAWLAGAKGGELDDLL